MTTETKLGLGATGTFLGGTASFFAPEHTPHDWTFVHQYSADFHAAGIALWGITGALALWLTGKRMNQTGWVSVDSKEINIVRPNPKDQQAGIAHDKWRARKAARRS